MSDITLITTGELILVAVIAGMPGALIGAWMGVRRAPENRALGFLIGFVIGFFMSLGLAFVALLVLVK
ncbi:MAG: hypothetical protein R3D43_02265 [Tepidamorphaceae bacterium]|nr:hypothetical protein [Rhodobiaceae bacterium]MCC0049595.1 hypothetical protein [Rhodobiaceae bacterium]